MILKSNPVSLSFLLSAIVLVTTLLTFKSLSGSMIQYSGNVKKFRILKGPTNSIQFERIELIDSLLVPDAKADSAFHGEFLSDSFPLSSFTILKNPTLLTWMIFFSITIAAAAALLILYGVEIAKLLVQFINQPWLRLLIVILIFSIFGLMSSRGTSLNVGQLNYISAYTIIDQLDVLFVSTETIRTLTSISTAVGFLGLMGIVLVPICTATFLKSKKTFLEQFDTILSLNSSLSMFFASSAILIGFSLTNTGIIKQTLMHVIQIKGIDIFPSEYVYSYGLFFTIVLAAIYLPAEHFMRRAVQNISTEGWPDKNLKKYEKASEQTGGLKNIQTLLAIMAPLAGSILPDVVAGLPKF